MLICDFLIRGKNLNKSVFGPIYDYLCFRFPQQGEASQNGILTPTPLLLISITFHNLIIFKFGQALQEIVLGFYLLYRTLAVVSRYK